jgi:hypothetical protein
MTPPRILQALAPVIQAFQEIGISYQIGGSIASSAYGIARSTIDVDILADISAFHIRQLIVALRGPYYIDEDRVRDAVSRRSSLNMIHLKTMMKINIFLLKAQPYDQAAFARSRLECLTEEEEGRLFSFASPEDVILNKLDWYCLGGCVSERRWNDVLGIFKAQQSALDYEYLQHWAEALGLSELLKRARQDSDLG